MQRPNAVSAFGFLNIAKGIAGIGGTFWTLAMFSNKAVSQNPVIGMMLKNADYMQWVKLMIPLGLAASVVALAAGVGLLKLKEWARRLSIGFAIYTIVFVPVNGIVGFKLLFHPMFIEGLRLRGPEGIAMLSGAVGGVAPIGLGLIYPALLIFFMTRPNVIAAFRPPTSPPPLPDWIK